MKCTGYVFTWFVFCGWGGFYMLEDKYPQLVKPSVLAGIYTVSRLTNTESHKIRSALQECSHGFIMEIPLLQ